MDCTPVRDVEVRDVEVGVVPMVPVPMMVPSMRAMTMPSGGGAGRSLVGGALHIDGRVVERSHFGGGVRKQARESRRTELYRISRRFHPAYQERLGRSVQCPSRFPEGH